MFLRLLGNIISDPTNPKYRQVKLTNKTIEEKLLPASGAFEILFSVGFEEAEDRCGLRIQTQTFCFVTTGCCCHWGQTSSLFNSFGRPSIK